MPEKVLTKYRLGDIVTDIATGVEYIIYRYYYKQANDEIWYSAYKLTGNISKGYLAESWLNLESRNNDYILKTLLWGSIFEVKEDIISTSGKKRYTKKKR